MSKVGPGRRPKSTGFRKRVSGNPAGRPRKERPAGSTSAFDVVIDKTLTIEQDGKSREVTIEEALWYKTYQNAIAGDRSAQREVLKMIKKREKYLAAERKPRASGGSFVIEPDPTNADKALLILGIAARNPDRQQFESKREWLLLEPWAVQAALSRRRGGSKLTEEEIEVIRRCTRDAATLRWPRGTAE